jgi:hypothetical protein
MKRKKRLKKGIESLKEIIEEHKKKLENTMIEGKEELGDYYSKEIKSKEEQLEKKKKQFSRK